MSVKGLLIHFVWLFVPDADESVAEQEVQMLMVILIVAVRAQLGVDSTVGVNVYVFVVVLSNTGDHEPEIVLLEVVGNAEIVAPEQ